MTVQDYPITNTNVYKFADGKYHVSFDARNVHYEFNGMRNQILPQIALRLKRILNVR